MAALLYPTNSAGQAVRSGLAKPEEDFREGRAFPPLPPPDTKELEASLVPAGDGDLVSYRAFDSVVYTMRQYLGKYTAVLLTPQDLDVFTVSRARDLVDFADLLYASYQEFYGLEPSGSGRLRIAFVKTCGAGCGYVGSRGVELDPGYADNTIPEIQGVLVHEMNHNFDRFGRYIFFGSDTAHAWNDFVDSYIRLVDRGGSRTRPPEANVQRKVEDFFLPYYTYPGFSWESCILNAACTDVSPQHSQGGMVLRLAQLLGVPATRESLRKLREFITTRGLGSSLPPEQKADLILESFSYGARTNLACYFDTWRWPVSAGLRAQLNAAFGASNAACADLDRDGYSVVQGDLDDSQASVHPGAPEVLNGIDDDCNFVVDDLLFTEAGDFPGSVGSAFAISAPGRVRGALTASDGDFFRFTLANPANVRFSIRSVDGVFRGWLFLYRQGTTQWRNSLYVGAGNQSEMTEELGAGAWVFGVELNTSSSPGQYEVVIEPVVPWPVLVYPPAPVNLYSNVWRLSTPPVPPHLAGVSNLLARFWVSGFGWVATNPVPSSAGSIHDWPAPPATVLSLARYRVQFYAGDFAAERATEATWFLSNTPPVLQFVTPQHGESLVVGADLTLQVAATDPEGQLRWVNLYQDDILLATLTQGPFTLTLTNLREGTYLFKAVAVDGPGETVTVSARVIVSYDRILIPPGAVWKYLDTGTDLGTVWRVPGFDDRAWPSGPAQLGYGDGDEATVVGYGPDESSKYITTYFRHAFYLSNAAAITNLAVGLLRDDGGVVYLNGVEIFRDNMPSGTISFSTRASSNASGDDETTRFHWSGVNPALLVNGTNVVAVEIHQDSSSSSDISFDLMLVAATTNQPPVATVTAPVDGVVLVAPATFVVNASGEDRDGLLTRLELYRNGVKVGERLASPLALTQSSLPPGAYTFFARALDHNGVAGTSAVVNVFVVTGSPLTLIPTGATWKYLDDGSDQGTAWRLLTFADGAWPSGPAQLGFGDGDERTVVRGNRTDGTRIITYYFRRSFVLGDASLVRGLTARLLRDDGAVVYLNGQEVWRSNMPEGTITYTTRAENTVNAPEESMFYSTNVDHTLLRAGTNVVAVEVHQVSSSSSDISFDFELRAVQVVPVSIPMTAKPAANGVALSWPAPAVGMRLYSATNLAAPVQWSPVNGSPLLTNGQYLIVVPRSPTINQFYRLQYP